MYPTRKSYVYSGVTRERQGVLILLCYSVCLRIDDDNGDAVIASLSEQRLPQNFGTADVTSMMV